MATTEMNPHNAVGLAEGFITPDTEDPEEAEGIILTAWQFLIDTGLAWNLQGSFGRQALHLIEQGLCTAPGSKTIVH